MTKDLEPFYQRLPHLEEERKQRLAYKRRQIELEGEAPYRPEISMASHRMSRGVDSLLAWGKEKEARQLERRHASEIEQREAQPFKPTISRRSREIAATMRRSSRDGKCYQLLPYTDIIPKIERELEVLERREVLSIITIYGHNS